ncbi:triosephosphate isomerase [Actibacterium mucosum KCTC 23349]|uniref:Triosephosphate isomerase n=1 Tax=Actibacterium mucosum KCTC 23349 TaxID=1454373 RepID=A0A037ZIW9_9RHOB|nr:triose-phosphate isomerase [Actibacterium mucosum]KAJ55482.1 triosephosphate isomerase [Actibacterium mucosum KCTC 23349]
MRRKLAAGNWKMNGLDAALSELEGLPAAENCDILLCPPATLLAPMVTKSVALGGAIKVGGQDCHANATGAHTGDIAAEMLADAGAGYVILGHSERRADHGETDADVAAKSLAARRAGLIAVVCIGETEVQYKAGETLDVIRTQMHGSLPPGSSLANTVIAYEPVWAIGTGLVPTTEEIAQVHGFIRDELATQFGQGMANGTRILYGGSVKPGNAAEIFATADVDGALVGGASLKAADFGAIITALDAA